MQTFLPLPSFLESARCLDYRRLGKQRLEARQILHALTGRSSGWANHPAARMWRGHETALASYGLICCQVWRDERGFRDNMAEDFYEYHVSKSLPDALDMYLGRGLKLPPWFGDERFHASHRSNLLRKNPEHYGQFGWTEAPDLPYYWPVC